MKSERLFLGNIPHAITEEGLKAWIEAAGCRVESLAIVCDRVTGKSRGFAFVTVESTDMAGLRQNLVMTRCMDRKITVGDAKPRPRRETQQNPDPREDYNR